MADEIKRVGLVFSADGTVDFKKSLTEINSLAKENYDNFKKLKSQYDENTTSTQKLKDQQNYLTKSIELYTSKQKTLQDEIEALKNKEGDNTDAIYKKQKQLDQCNKKLGEYQSGLTDVEKVLKSGKAQIDDYAQKIENLSKKATDVGKGMSKYVTAPIMAIGTASMVAWSEMDEAYDNIILKTGATGDALESLNDSFDAVFSSMPADAQDVSEAIGEVNTRFKLTGEELENTSKYFLQFAEITGSDVTESIGYAQKISGQWNITLEESQDVLGLIAKQSQDTGISVDTLMSNVTTNSSAFKEMGLSVGQSVNLMAQFESNGLDADQMLQGLKKASQNYAKEGKSMSDGLGDLITRLQDSTTYQEAYGEAIEIFGTKNALNFATACKEGKISVADLSSETDGLASVVSDTFEGTLDPVDNFTTAMNNLKLVGSELGTTIQTALAPVLEKLIKVLKNVSTWFKGLNDKTKTVIVTVGGLVASIGPLLIIIGTMGTKISSALKILGNLKLSLATNTSAFKVLSSAVGGLSAPMIAIIGVIGLVVVALLDLWENNENFRKSVVNIVNNIMSIVQTLWDSVLKPIINAIVQIINMLWTTCLKPLYENVKTIIAQITSFISAFMTFITPIVNTLVQLFGVVITNVLNNVLLPIFRTVFTAISNTVSTAFNLIQSIWNNILKPVFNAISSLIQNVLLPIFTVVFAGICTIVTNAFNGINSVWNNVLKPAFNTISSVINTLATIFSNVFGGIYNTVSRIFNNIKDAMTGPIETAKNTINTIITTIKGWFSGFTISLPHIKLPHFAISPRGWEFGDLLKGSIPKLSIDWYAKAMDKGMILDGATIFGMNKNGELMGGGEKGSETIVGTDSLMDMIRKASNSGNEDILNALLSIANRLSPDNLYKVVVKAINDGGFVIMLDNREVGRLVKKYA